MTPKWDLIGLGGDLGDFWSAVQLWGGPQSKTRKIFFDATYK